MIIMAVCQAGSVGAPYTAVILLGKNETRLTIQASINLLYVFVIFCGLTVVQPFTDVLVTLILQHRTGSHYPRPPSV